MSALTSVVLVLMLSFVVSLKCNCNPCNVGKKIQDKVCEIHKKDVPASMQPACVLSSRNGKIFDHGCGQGLKDGPRCKKIQGKERELKHEEELVHQCFCFSDLCNKPKSLNASLDKYLPEKDKHVRNLTPSFPLAMLASMTIAPFTFGRQRTTAAPDRQETGHLNVSDPIATSDYHKTGHLNGPDGHSRSQSEWQPEDKALGQEAKNPTVVRTQPFDARQKQRLFFGKFAPHSLLQHEMQ